MRIVVCGSMSASKQMVELQNFFASKGHEVIIPQDADKYASGELLLENNRESMQHKIDHDLIREHYLSIVSADMVIIANYDKGNIKNYIGGNSFLEAGFAHVLNKKLYFINDIPEMIYTDELRALQPVILNGDLSQID